MGIEAKSWIPMHFLIHTAVLPSFPPPFRLWKYQPARISQRCKLLEIRKHTQSCTASCTDALPRGGVANLATSLPKGPEAEGKVKGRRWLDCRRLLPQCLKFQSLRFSHMPMLSFWKSSPSGARSWGDATPRAVPQAGQFPPRQPPSLFCPFSPCCVVRRLVSTALLPQKEHSVRQVRAALPWHWRLKKFQVPVSLFCSTKQEETALRNRTCAACEAKLPRLRRVFYVRTKTKNTWKHAYNKRRLIIPYRKFFSWPDTVDHSSGGMEEMKT